MLISTLFAIAREWDQTIWSPEDEWLTKINNRIHFVEKEKEIYRKTNGNGHYYSK